MPKKTDSFIEPHCSFCGKPESQVEHLIAAPGNGVFICNECVDICRSQLDDSRGAERSSEVD